MTKTNLTPAAAADSAAKREIAARLRFIDETEARIAGGDFANPWQEKLAMVQVSQAKDRILELHTGGAQSTPASVNGTVTPATLAKLAKARKK